MNKINNIFLKKKILIYGLGKSGISTYNFLRQKAEVYLFDDNFLNNFRFNKKSLRYSKILKRCKDAQRCTDVLNRWDTAPIYLSLCLLVSAA